MSPFVSMASRSELNGSDEPQVVVANKALLTIAVMTAMVMQVLDTTIANVALPHMQSSLGATRDSITWVLTSYIVASAVALPATGWLADRMGARNLFLASVTTFVLASILCGLATSLETMVAYRAIQGVAGAFIGPLAQTVMLNINRPSQHAKSMSIYGMGVMIGPVAGPVLGGFLTESFNWRWVFFVNLPIGIVCIAGLLALLPRVPTARRSFDGFGWALIAIALGSLQLLLDRGHLVDWFQSTEIWIYAGLIGAAFWVFVIHSITASAPLFPRQMLKDRNLVTGTFFMFITGMAIMAVMALLPPMLQTLYGYPVIESGMLLATRGIGIILTMGIAGRLTGRVDARLLIGAGFAITALSLWQMSHWSPVMSWHPIALSGFVQGLGLGFVFVPLNVISFSTLAPQYRTDATSLINLSRNFGASVGIAIVTAFFARNVQVVHADLAADATAASLPIDPYQVQAYGAYGDRAIAMFDMEINRQALMISYLNDFWLMMFICLGTLPLLLLMNGKARGTNSPPPIIAD